MENKSDETNKYIVEIEKGRAVAIGDQASVTNYPIGKAVGDSVIAIGGDADNNIIVTGDQNVVRRGKYVVGSNVHITPETLVPVISAEQAYERIGAAVRLNLSQLERNIEQARRESSQFFTLTLIFSGVGFLIVAAGVILLFASQVTAGIVASVSSIVPEVTAVLFFKKDQELRKSIESYHRHTLDSQQILTMIDVAETIKNTDEKDRMKQQIIFKVLGINNPA
jgi:Cyanobacterial TRADD-N associated 2-Transmembrane domain